MSQLPLCELDDSYPVPHVVSEEGKSRGIPVSKVFCVRFFPLFLVERHIKRQLCFPLHAVSHFKFLSSIFFFSRFK